MAVAYRRLVARRCHGRKPTAPPSYLSPVWPGCKLMQLVLLGGACTSCVPFCPQLLYVDCYRAQNIKSAYVSCLQRIPCCVLLIVRGRTNLQGSSQLSADCLWACLDAQDGERRYTRAVMVGEEASKHAQAVFQASIRGDRLPRRSVRLLEYLPYIGNPSTNACGAPGRRRACSCGQQLSV